ncbi:hypothetical protein [Streptomyces sp. NPDC055287]
MHLQKLRLSAALVMLLMLFIAAQQVDSALGRIEAPGHPSATLGSLFRFTAWSEGAREERRTAWCVWTEANLPDIKEIEGPSERVTTCKATFQGTSAHESIHTHAGGDQARALMRVYVILDFILIALYLSLFVWAVRRLRNKIPSKSSDSEADDPAHLALRRATHGWWLGGLVFLMAVSEIVENICQFWLSLKHLTPDDIDTLNSIAGWAGLVKWLSIGLAVLLLVVLVVRTKAHPWWGWLADATLVRLQLGMAAVLLLLLTGVGTDQTQDALLGLLDRWSTAVSTPLAVLVFALLLWRSVHRTALTYDKPRQAVPQGIVLLVAVVCFCVGFFFWRRLVGLGVLLVLVLVLSVLGGASLWRGHAEETGYSEAESAARERAEVIGRDRRSRLEKNARLLAALPLLVLGVFVVRAAVATVVVGSELKAVLLVVLGVVAALFGTAMPGILQWAEQEISWAQLPAREDKKSGLYFVLTGVCALFAVAFVLNATVWREFNTPAHVGPLAVLTVFLCLALAVMNELQRWSELSVPVAGFRVLHLKRTPVFTILLSWLVLASLVDTTGSHPVALRNENPSDAHAAGKKSNNSTQQSKLVSLFEDWFAANCTTESRTGPLPLVIVAASGGGIRAAYWTSGVLDRLFPPTPVKLDKHSACEPTDERAPVFAVSGISGGSLGAISWLSRPQQEDSNHHKRVFGADHLSLPLAWMTFVDLPRAFFGFPGKDRARVMEESWETKQGDLQKPFYATWHPPVTPWVPLALLNGTSVESGCRVLTAPVLLGGFDRPVGPTSCTRRPEDVRAKDLRPGETNEGGPTLIDVGGAFLCGDQEIRRSTAALLSARFPYITPSGRLTGQKCGNDASLSVVDGGYVDATGSLTAIDLYNELKEVVDCGNQVVRTQKPAPKHCGFSGGFSPDREVEMLLLQIDNGYNSVASTSSPGRPHETLVPITSLRGAGATRSANARQRAFKAFGCEHYVRFANVRGPGTQAPLGWTMSQSAQSNLDTQLEEQTSLTLFGVLKATDHKCEEMRKQSQKGSTAN